VLKHPYLLLFTIFSLIGILIALGQVKAPQIFMPKASVIGVSLSLLPSKTTLDPGGEAVFDLVLNPDGEIVSAIELVLNFDQSLIQITDIKPTDKLPQTLALNLTEAGKASIILLAAPGSNQAPDGVVGRVFVKAIKSGSTPLKFDSTTKVSAAGKTGDVTGAVEAAEIAITSNGEDLPNINLSEEKPSTRQADELIKSYLETKSTLEQASQSGGLVNIFTKTASDYFKSVVIGINKAVEKQARRFLD
jgi:hypothetical protein